MNKYKCAKPNSNKQHDHGVRTFHPTSPLPTPEEKSTITIRFGSRNFYTLGLQVHENSHTTQSLNNHTLHTKCRNLARVLLLKCSITTSP